MIRVLVPMPSMEAPMATSSRQTSWTCGSDAAFLMMVVPFAKLAAMTTFSVAMTLISSRKMSAPLSPWGARIS